MWIHTNGWAASSRPFTVKKPQDRHAECWDFCGIHVWWGGVPYTSLIPVLTYNFDGNALLGDVCWGGGGKKKGSWIPGSRHSACLPQDEDGAPPVVGFQAKR